jgi:Cdc6-like AAA superfamily ATPase
LSDTIKRRHDGTGEWLLASTEYQTWINNKKKTMFCSGIPGAGKTVLTAIAIHDLCSQFQENPEVGIAYIFCNFQRHGEQTFEHLLLSLLKQLLQYRNPLPDFIRDFYRRRRDSKMRASINEILNLLEFVAATFPSTFILVDALDECQTADGCRMSFLTELFNLQKKANLNIFATSRYNEEIASMFRDCLSLSITASADDIKLYVGGQIRRVQSDIVDDEIRDLIETEVLEAANGMYVFFFFVQFTELDSLTNLPGSCSRPCI